MSGQFIFIATNRLKEGKFAEERRRVPGLCDFIEANEPRLIAFHEYASEDGTEVGVVQVHPDAESGGSRALRRANATPIPDSALASTGKRARSSHADRSASVVAPANTAEWRDGSH